MIHEAITDLEPVADESANQRRILIVDDDPGHVESLAFRLRQQGYETIQAFQGREGMVRARRDAPHLILLDVRLPDIDGLEVCEQLVDSPETCDIPVILVSGVDRPDMIRTARAAGCQYFLRKPFDPNALLALIEASMDTIW